MVEDGARATLNWVRLFRGGQVLQKTKKRRKPGNELSRWRKDPTGRDLRKETPGAWSRKERTRASVVCDGEVAASDQPEPFSPRGGFGYYITGGF